MLVNNWNPPDERHPHRWRKTGRNRRSVLHPVIYRRRSGRKQHWETSSADSAGRDSNDSGVLCCRRTVPANHLIRQAGGDTAVCNTANREVDASCLLTQLDSFPNKKEYHAEIPGNAGVDDCRPDM
jgi:hypothetical protein